MAFNLPFDLQFWFVNNLAGTLGIFIAIAFLFMGIVSAYFKMPNSVTLMMFILFPAIFAVHIGQGLLALVIIVLGIVVYSIFSRIIK